MKKRLARGHALSSEKGPGANSDRGLFRGREIPADYNFILTIAWCSSSLRRSKECLWTYQLKRPATLEEIFFQLFAADVGEHDAVDRSHKVRAAGRSAVPSQSGIPGS